MKKAVARSLVGAVMIGIAMYLLDALYHYHEKQAVIKSLETSPYANVIQYFPETFRFYLITDSPWLDALIVAGAAFGLLFMAARLTMKRARAV